MKKVFVPVLVVLVLLASVTPAFAKGHPPFNHGQEMKNQKLGVASEGTLAPNGKPGNGADKLHGNSAKEGRNFVLFGTLKDVTIAKGDKAGTITVNIISGNVAVHGFEGEDVVVQVPDGAKIKLMQGDGVNWGTLDELKEGFNEQIVRVHGWVTPETTVTPAAEGETKVPGVWTASQVYTLSENAQSDVSNPDDGSGTETEVD
jgi:hypothetical protein